MSYHAAVITVSDESFWGRREDATGPAVVEILEQSGYKRSEERRVRERV